MNSDAIRNEIQKSIYANEIDLLQNMLRESKPSANSSQTIRNNTINLIQELRSNKSVPVLESFLQCYGLSSNEGVAIMCLAEAMLRVPDNQTIDELIKDKIVPHHWGSHVDANGSILVNASAWALMLTGTVLEKSESQGMVSTLRSAVRRVGEPVIRKAVYSVMKELGSHFILGESIEKALKNGAKSRSQGFTFSFDMLGEAARTEEDANQYFKSYYHAISELVKDKQNDAIHQRPSISVKLSALHPNYEYYKKTTLLYEIFPRLLKLCQAAADGNVGLTIDAEEARRLDISLDIIHKVFTHPSLKNWEGLGIVVQAYGLRSHLVIDWIHQIAVENNKSVPVRLVKGAYWDSEIKESQVNGAPGFPVFTRKSGTDISYLFCAKKLLDARDIFYPQLATHNAHSLSSILEYAGEDKSNFEFQRLHGMGENLHNIVKDKYNTNCRIYAPVGIHKDLLAYLVRRLLENGATSSFVHQITDVRVSPATIAECPYESYTKGYKLNKAIVTPNLIFGDTRKNSIGWDINNPSDIRLIQEKRKPFIDYQWNFSTKSDPKVINNPADKDDIVGYVDLYPVDDTQRLFNLSKQGWKDWSEYPAQERTEKLLKAADLFEQNFGEMFALLARESGKVLLDCISELREAVDFLRYYAIKSNEIHNTKKPRGTFLCISPWNFPLAIFTGQIAAALATGNSVIAKPAGQTPLIASFVIKLLYQAGIPQNALQLVLGDGKILGAKLVAHSELAGVVFTGSTSVAKIIDRQLAKTAPEAVLIAETGGINAMIIDSTALIEQAVDSIIASAFQSSGQRCSALRILYIQEDAQKTLLKMLYGALDSLKLGNPLDLDTDIGPLIDSVAKKNIANYLDQASKNGFTMDHCCKKHQEVVKHFSGGNFLAPSILKVRGIKDLKSEIFGPVLHIASFKAANLNQVIKDINNKQYGLTFGLQSRIDKRAQLVVDEVQTGNIYINRNQIGAIVGSQPFGGEKLSGTGPKAGGPLYLDRFYAQENDKIKQLVYSKEKVNGEMVKSSQVISALADAKQKAKDLKWDSRRDKNSKIREILRGRNKKDISLAVQIDMGPIDLPGPTGESNRYYLKSYGAVLCLGPSLEDSMNQIIFALSMGNYVVAIHPEIEEELKASKLDTLPVVGINGQIEPIIATKLPFQVYAYKGGNQKLRVALASLDGSIKKIVTSSVSAHEYAKELTVCIDTTAAGGNTTLLTEVG